MTPKWGGEVEISKENESPRRDFCESAIYRI